MVVRDLPEEDLEPLPPLDGDARDRPEPEPDYGPMLDENAEDATLDDTTAEDDPLDDDEMEIDPVEDGWLGAAGEAQGDARGDPQDLDLGDDGAIVDFGDETSLLADTEERGLDDEDLIVGDAPEHGGLDAGDEGPIDADEELRDADLPALDADEEGDMDDAALVDAGFASDEPLGLPWAAQPWLRVGAPVALVGATAVACAARGALVAGRSESGAPELLRVDLEGSCERLAAEGLSAVAITALAVDGAVVAAVMEGGRLFVSLDGGARFAPTAEPMGDAVLAAEAVFARGRLWVRSRTGGLVVLQVTAPQVTAQGTAPQGTAQASERPPPRVRSLRAGRERPIAERCPVPGVAAALTCDGAGPSDETSAVAVVVVDDAGRPTTLVRAQADASVRCEAVDAPVASSPAMLAVRGDRVAYAARHRGIVRRMAGSAAWQSFEWEGRVTALTFIDDAGTLVASAYSDADDTSALVRLDPEGNASVVARIGASPEDAESDGRVVALAHDEARGVVWVAGGFGLAAFATR